MSQVCLKKAEKISEQPLMIKLGFSSGPTYFDGLRRRIACLTSESEMEGKFKKSEKIKRALFKIITKEGELKIEEKLSTKASTNTLRLCYFIFTNFELDENLIIPFKLRDIFPQIFRFNFQIVFSRFWGAR
jgi:hypothetical protein